MHINKDYIVYGVAALIFLLILSFFPFWYFTVRAPQYRIALTFLEALKRRNERMLKVSVAVDEFVTYKELYLRNGYNKHLLHYDNVEAKETDGVFTPHRVRFAVLGREDDVFFGERELSYVLSLERINDEWKVVQFASYEDTGDLRDLRKIRTQVVAPPL
jgi:hypothetical protein